MDWILCAKLVLCLQGEPVQIYLQQGNPPQHIVVSDCTGEQNHFTDFYLAKQIGEDYAKECDAFDAMLKGNK